MSPTGLTELLQALRTAGAQLSVAEGKLRVEAPAGALSPALQHQLRLHRDDLIALIGGRSDGPIGPTSSGVGEPASLSHAQERVWLVQELEPESTAYNLVPVVRLDGPLDLQRLRTALTRLLDRHEPLRTRIVNTGGVAELQVDPVPADLLRIEDISHLLPHQDRTGRGNDAAGFSEVAVSADATSRSVLNDIVLREQARPFDLEHEIPFRAVLVRAGPEEHHLVTAFHHIAVDGTSLVLFYRDLIELYASREPAPLRIRYCDYARWERALWQGERLLHALAFWTGQLDGAPPSIDLPADFPRPAVQSYTGAMLERVINPAAATRLGEVARAEGASLFLVLLAAFGSALQRASGERDVVIGAPVDGRTRPELRDLVGMFVNQIALRLDVPKAATFRDLLIATRNRARDAFIYQDLPFSLLVNALDLPRDRSRTPVFQVMVNVLPPSLERITSVAHNVHFSAPDEQQLRDLFDGQAKFDLTLYGREHDGSIHLSLVYNRDLFGVERMRMFFDQLEMLLVEGTRNPDRPVDDLLEPVNLSDTPGDSIGDGTVIDRVFAGADAGASHPALIDASGAVTWSELREAAIHIARRITRIRESAVSPVGVFVEHGAPAAAAIVGVLLSGRPYVPLDPSYPAARLRFMAEDSGLAVVLASAQLVDNARAIFGDSVHVLPVDAQSLQLEEHEILTNTETPSAGSLQTSDTASAWSFTLPRPDDTAYLLYTSGSTGQPKAVVQTHRNLLAQAERYARAHDITEHDRVTLTASLSFDASLMDLFGGLLRGATVVFVDLTRVDLAALPDTLRAHNCTTLHTTPTVFRTLAHSAPDARFENIRAVVLGGEPVTTREVAYFDAAFAPAARLFNLYGSAEHSFSFTHEIPRDLHLRSGEVPIGQPIGDVQPVLLDNEGQPDPVRGELAIRSSANARGYWRRTELTASAFVPDPRNPGTTLYRTGDIVRRRPDGQYVFLHRADRQLKIRGHRIEPLEVEAVLTLHPDIVEAAVHGTIGVNEILQLAASLVVRSTAEAVLPELHSWCRARLPAYAVPSSWSIVGTLPRTPSGKIDYRQLSTAGNSATRTVLAPRNAEELALRELWSEVLNLNERLIGVTADFFELGGNSLSATQVTARVRSVFEIELPLRQFFDQPTIAETAEWIRANRFHQPVLPPVEPAGPIETIPLSYSQERMWFLQELSPTDTAYNMARTAKLTGPFDVDRFFRAVDVVAQRQEMLRTVIPTERGRPHQLVQPVPNHETHRIDLRALPQAKRLDIARDRLNDMLARPFDLATGPLMRVAVAILDEQEVLLAVGLHHVAGDQWSFGIFTREVARVYEHGPDVLAPLRVQYRDYAAWQRRFLAGPLLTSQLEYWKTRLRDLRPLDLPTDHPRPAVFSFRGDNVLAPISAELEQGIHRIALSLKATPFMVLLAAFKVLLNTRTRHDDIVVGVPIANRTQREAEELIGTFVNTLVHRTDLSGEPTFRQLVEQVRQNALDAYTHQDLPFEFLVKELNPPRDTSRAPIFQVMFNHANAPAPTRWLEGVAAEPLVLRLGVAQFDLTLNVLFHESGSGIQLSYCSDLFDHETAVRFVDHYVEILQRAVAAPDLHIAQLGELPSNERLLLLEEWNRSEYAWPDDADLPQMVARQAERTPNQIAVDSPTGRYTYLELVDAAQRISAALRFAGIVPGDRVAIVMERSRELLAGLLGILGAGAAYVPIDPTYPEVRVRYMLQQSGAAIVLTHGTLTPPLALDVPVLDASTVLHATAPDSKRLRREGTYASQRGEFTPADPDRAAYVIFTSGSTGQPKGVEVPHRALTNFLHSMKREPGITSNDKLLAVTTISFDIAALELFLPLIAGARVVIAGEREVSDGHVLTRRLRDEDITLMQATPATWKLLLATGWSGKRDLRVLCGGEALPPALAEQLLERVAELWNMFGPTETTVWSTVQRILPGEPIVIGRPITNTQVYVLDPTLRPVPIGVPGELWIGGAGVASGYIGRPELTAERFLSSPFRPGDRIYRTGDLVRYRPDGRLEHLGRLDHQVKVRGYRIELGEVEAALRAEPAVRDAIVIARDDRLIAYIVHEVDAAVSAELRHRLAELLPAYMIPSVFVSLDAFPLTANGKVDRNRLPEPERITAHTEFDAPLLPGERIIAEVWGELLELEHIARGDNFFELGGHSLLAMEAVALVEERTGYRLEPRALFFKTLQDLAASIPQPELVRT